MRNLFQLLIVLISVTSFAQKGKLYKGTIHHNLKITLYLNDWENGTYADAITGTYKYESSNDFLLLSGYINSDGNIVLVEQSSVNFSGVFLGTISNQTIQGKWMNANQKKNFVFKLQEVIPSDMEIKRFKNAISEKAEEFRNY